MESRYNCVIRFADGSYYTGRAGEHATGNKSEALPYSEVEAKAKIARLQHTPLFSKASIEKVTN
ncbi:MAG: hypothetical protein M0R77_07725 [Gammaproteobacteria bacterium]|nr:hypothetical protein [Gammaproteobacteria bacterium]